MSRFFFDVEYGGALFVDADGTELLSRQLAQHEALLIALEIARDEFATLDGEQRLEVRVRDTIEFYRTTLTVAIETSETASTT